MIVSARSIPNLLGLFRIVTTPLLVVLILLGTPGGYLGAVALLLLMAASDIADGPLARKLQVVSPLGVFLDTTSDKIFVASALIPMVERGLLPGWVALVIIVRDFVISGLRSYAAAEGQVISARPWGKQKLVITVIALVWRLLAAAIIPGAPPFVLTYGGLVGIPLLLARLVSVWPIPLALALVWTVFSGGEYLWKAWPLLNSQLTPHAPPDSTPRSKSSAK